MNILISDIQAVLPGTPCQVSRCSVYITGSTIASINAAPAGFVPDMTISGADKLLIPGLVNAHTHSYMTAFRNAADDLSFQDWLFGRIMPMEDKLTAEDCYWTSLLGCMEMIAGGTTCFSDMHMFPHVTAQAVHDSGIRAVLSRGLTGGKDDPEGGKRRIREALEEIDRWQGYDRLSFMLAPHAPYTCDEDYLREIAHLAKERGLAIHTHLAESAAEDETVLERYGCSPARFFARTGLFENHTVAAHCVRLSDEDMDLLADHGVSVAACPVSNLKLANGIAPIPHMLEKGINVALGTDGAASNNTLDMLREMSFTALLHKGSTGDPRCVSAAQTLQMATCGGARALHINAGEIRPGALADLAILDMSAPHMQPHNDPVAALSYSAAASDVETVIIHGEPVYHGRRFTKIDTGRVYAEVDRICQRIGTRK